MEDNLMFERNGLAVPVSFHGVMAHNSDAYFVTYCRKTSAGLLNALCDKHGSDKGEIAGNAHPYPWPSHSYADFLERLFGHCRHGVRAVFECGLGTPNPAIACNMGADGRPGASLRVWRDYFPQAQIVGADIDRDVLFSEERISTYHCDQTSAASIRQMWEQCPVAEFDLMVDDGLHSFEAGRCLFENAFHKLRPGGLYIIEDVSMTSMLMFKSYLKDTRYDYDVVALHRKGLPLGDNCLLVLRK